MTRPHPRPQPPGKGIEDVARLIEESSFGTVGARQLRDRTVTSTAAVIRARAYLTADEGGQAWWQAHQHNPDALRRKASELASRGELEMSDVLTRLAIDQQNLPDSTDIAPEIAGNVTDHQKAAADWRSFEAFYHRELARLSKILAGEVNLPWSQGKELVHQAMVKAFDEWEHLAASGNPAEWVIGCALQLYRNRQPADEDGNRPRAREDTPPGTVLVASPAAAAVQRTDVRVTGALAVAASRVPATGAAEIDAEAALCKLYSASYQSLVRLAVLLVRDVATAEEVVQDAFVAMHGAWGRLRDADKALSYLRQSVVNRSRSVLRHRAVVDKYAQKPAPEAPSAEQDAISRLDRSAVIAALRALPARQREALVLRYYADLPDTEIAKAMGISRGAVRNHTARGMSALRSVLEQES